MSTSIQYQWYDGQVNPVTEAKIRDGTKGAMHGAKDAMHGA